MTLVVKLGSSIVAADDGELRTDVLDSVCAQVSELERAGRADRDGHLRGADRAGDAACLELPVRPRAMDELQAASAVGQGDLFPRLREPAWAGSRHAVRAGAPHGGRPSPPGPNYLNAPPDPCGRLVEWGGRAR